MRLLCLSNGHGEDEIAVRILRELQHQQPSFEIAALPLVGEGFAYQKAQIPLIGAVKTMPSGGFIYMDGRQLVRDLKGGLVQLTRRQLQATQAWVAADKSTSPDKSLILAVGDIVPLIFAWLSRANYAFVGTAKSEYYLRDEQGWLPRPWIEDLLAKQTNCIYLPWERWLMQRPRCKAVFPRDRLTTHFLQQKGIAAFDLGNPMMDGLICADASASVLPSTNLTSEALAEPLTLLLLPGSRPPEAYRNWEVLLDTANCLINEIGRPLVFLAAIAPAIELAPLQQALRSYRWQQLDDHRFTVGIGERQANLILGQNYFAEFLQRAEVAIAMAGTATEQFVGYGKPAITIPGEGPQFTPHFAEAQARLLGPSITPVMTPKQVPNAIRTLLQNPDQLHLIRENGQRRMGKPGAAQRIAHHLSTLR